MGTGHEPARESLLRQLYWEGGSAPRATLDAPELRERLLEFTAQMRTDERMQVPYGEEAIRAGLAWRRRAKVGVFRVLRPVSRRYDRVVGDLADLTVGLADRLIAVEAEVRRLRELLGEDPPADPDP